VGAALVSLGAIAAAYAKDSKAPVAAPHHEGGTG
jgi:hypothetical protein